MGPLNISLSLYFGFIINTHEFDSYIDRFLSYIAIKRHVSGQKLDRPTD